MKILVIGSGGREHALCVRLAASASCEGVWCVPGSDGIAEVATCLPELMVDRLEGIVAAAVELEIELVVIGPDAPVVAGLADKVRAAGMACFGPGKAAAQLEGSKAFMKDLCAKAEVPTARSRAFVQGQTEATEVLGYVAESGYPAVIKASGLAQGKGVWIVEDEGEAREALAALWGKQAFGGAGQTLVVEEFLQGWELSLFVLCDDTTLLPFGCAQDHKRVGEGDTGPMTGGMGAFSPVAEATPALQGEIVEKIARPLMVAMQDAGTPFIGVMFLGIMVTAKGPQLLEVNVRFGDPETQVLLPLLAADYDFAALLAAVARGQLATAEAPRWQAGAAVGVVVAAAGYPGAFQRGDVIGELKNVVHDVQVFHANTRKVGDEWQSYGGRVLTVVGQGEDLAAARQVAYAAVEQIGWAGGFYRRDIGLRVNKIRV